MFGHIFAYFLEEPCGEYEIVEGFVGCVVDLAHVADPLAVALVDEYDILADAEDTVHVVGVYDGGYIIFVGDVAEEFVDKDGCLGVEAGVWLVAEEILGVEGDCPGNGHAFLHAARYFGGILVFGAFEVDALEAEECALGHFLLAHFGEHDQREHDVSEHCLGVEERGALKEHADFLAEILNLFGVHGEKVAAVEEYLALIGAEKADERFHEHGFARTALTDYEVGLAGVESGVYVV